MNEKIEETVRILQAKCDGEWGRRFRGWNPNSYPTELEQMMRSSPDMRDRVKFHGAVWNFSRFGHRPFVLKARLELDGEVFVAELFVG